MSLTVELSDALLARLQIAAAARGISVEQLAVQTLAQIPPVDADFATIVARTIGEHRETLDRLAAT